MNARSYPLSDHAVFRIRLSVVEGSQHQLINRSGRTIYVADGQYTDSTSIKQNAFAIILPKSEYRVGAAQLEWISIYATPIQFIGTTDDVLTLVTWLAGEYGSTIPTSTEFVQLEVNDQIEAGDVIVNTIPVHTPTWQVSQWNSLLIRIRVPLSPLARPTIFMLEGSDDNVTWTSVQRFRPAFAAYGTINPMFSFFRIGFYTYSPVGYTVNYRVRMTRRIFAPLAYTEPWGIIREEYVLTAPTMLQIPLGRRSLFYTNGRLIRGVLSIPTTTPFDPSTMQSYIPFCCSLNTPWECVIPAEVAVLNILDIRPSGAVLGVQHISDI
ncbi:MAG: hypothetical protein QXT45_07040 [Candidatus Bilamarchaeaceae archaeon]